MAYKIDETDVAIINSLIEDGRKSFRQISRELKISTPTVKFRYQRLINIGLIKSVSPIIDTSKIDKRNITRINKCHNPEDLPTQSMEENMLVKISCDYCQRTVGENPPILKIGDYERFFCCTSCKHLYKEKHRGRIESLNVKFQNKIRENSLKTIITTGSLFTITGICIEHGIFHSMHSGLI